MGLVAICFASIYQTSMSCASCIGILTVDSVTSFLCVTSVKLCENVSVITIKHLTGFVQCNGGKLNVFEVLSGMNSVYFVL